MSSRVQSSLRNALHNEADFGFGTRGVSPGRVAMRWCVSIGVVLAAGALMAGDATSLAAPNTTSVQAQKVDDSKRVDVELILAVDVSYSMDMDELAIQREGYAG